MTETVLEEAQAQDLLNNNFITTCIHVIKELEKTVDKELKETKIMIKQIENIRKEKKIRKRKQIENSEKQSQKLQQLNFLKITNEFQWHI